jgi:hypothetical protein
MFDKIEDRFFRSMHQWVACGFWINSDRDHAINGACCSETGQSVVKR